jgi:pilus assembly protein CpaE
MLDSRSSTALHKARILVFTADSEFEQAARSSIGAHAQIHLELIDGGIAVADAQRNVESAAVIVADVDADQAEDIAVLQRLAMRFSGTPPIIVVTKAFSETLARRLLQIRIADFLVKPVSPVDLVRACARVTQSSSGENLTEAQIYTFLPAAGGVGLTTIAIETAMLLLRHGQRDGCSTCLVDLDFQQGACADYLDIEPRLDLHEIAPRPERLDRQLLEVMTSHHSSGLSVIATPNRPAEMRLFDPAMVTRLLDLVSTQFHNVVIDLPRTWFSWTDNVLLGSNNLFIVTQMTVPGLRHAKHLMAAITDRVKEGPSPRVIVNRFENRLFGTGLRRGDIEQALGDAFAGTIPNNYRLVSEAIDRGVPLEEVKPGNNIAGALKKLVLPAPVPKPIAQHRGASAGDRSFVWAR